MKSFVMKWCLAVLVLGITACATKVETDYKPGADFSAYKTFSWYDKTSVPKKGEVVNTLFDDRVRSAIQNTLKLRGYSEGKSPDFLVTYHFSVEQKLESRDVSVGLAYSPRGWGWGAGVNTGTTVNQYEEGTLMIDILDAAGKELLWRGYVQERLYGSKTPEEREEDIQEAVTAILTKFPPQ